MSKIIKSGEGLEKLVKNILNAKGGNIRYDDDKNLKLQTDIVIPNIDKPEVIYSITHTNPDKPGHSNENKFQLKLGELVLIKTFNPKIKCIMVIGGTKEAWLPYVLVAFSHFFDEVIFLWESGFEKKILNAGNCELKNVKFWDDEKNRRQKLQKTIKIESVPFSELRLKFWSTVIKNNLGVLSPDDIKHPILKLMGSSAHKAYQDSIGGSGKFWLHLSKKNHDAIWQERNYFNPNEAVVETILLTNNFFFMGKTGTDVEITNLLHEFGLTRTRVAEDFVLFSKKHNKPVYIQCKASGGGKTHHGKNIMNRSKEQNGRSILYRCKTKNTKLISETQNFIWISILDGNWKLPKKTPTKYYSMLKIAGYDKIIGAESLVTASLIPKPENDLKKYLEELDCYKVGKIPNSLREKLFKKYKTVSEIK